MLQVFFHESPSPKPLKITLESMLIISKIRGDIRKSRCTTGVNGNDTGGKFAIGVVDTGGNLPPGSLTSPANLPPVSTTQGEQVAKFAAGVVDTGLRISPRMFEKIRNDPDVIIRGLGEGDS